MNETTPTLDALNSADAFNFDAMNKAVGKDPFASQANKYAKDERFYTLQKDKDGNGAAIIRFLPDANMDRSIEIYRIGTTIVKNGKKRFVNEFTPATIGLPCPFQEKWAELYNAGDKEGSKAFGRSRKYISNIKVIKDPANPENEGKIFLYEYSGTIKKKLEGAQKPSETDLALGKTVKEVFNPIVGNSFRLVSQKGENKQINYDASEVVAEVDGIYATPQEAVDDIKANTHTLADLLKPEAFMSYEDLQKKMKWVTWQDGESAVKPVQAVPEVQPATTVAVPEVQAPTTSATETVVSTPESDTQPTASATSLDALMAGLAS